MLEIPELDLLLNKGATKPKPIVGNEMWNVAARSNGKRKVVRIKSLSGIIKTLESGNE